MRNSSISWGIMPDEVYEKIWKREWSSLGVIRKRLSGKKSFPIRFNLKPPAGNDALEDIVHFQEFISKWNSFPHEYLLEKEWRKYRNIGDQIVPKALIISSFKELIDYLGPEVKSQCDTWELKMKPLLHLDQNLFSVCVDNLEIFNKLSVVDTKLLASTLEQLKPRMGIGLYLRELPLREVDTKFVEQNELLIARCLDQLYNKEITQIGGLFNWLGCRPKPTGWLNIRPLCSKTRVRFGNLRLIKLPQDDVKELTFDCDTVIVVENDASGLSLPEIDNAVAVFGGGGNVSWMNSRDLDQKRVLYWGDIDSHGFKFLSDARGLCRHTESVMMDESTVLRFEDRMCEDSLFQGEVPNLNESENMVFTNLLNGKYAGNRLEQERISQDYINCIFRSL